MLQFNHALYDPPTHKSWFLTFKNGFSGWHIEFWNLVWCNKMLKIPQLTHIFMIFKKFHGCRQFAVTCYNTLTKTYNNSNQSPTPSYVCIWDVKNIDYGKHTDISATIDSEPKTEGWEEAVFWILGGHMDISPKLIFSTPEITKMDIKIFQIGHKLCSRANFPVLRIFQEFETFSIVNIICQKNSPSRCINYQNCWQYYS